jgi:hypothetical protein
MMKGLFDQVLKIVLEAGGLKWAGWALDGTKINANVGTHEAMSYDPMKRKERISVRRSKICWRRRTRPDAEEDSRQTTD